MLLKTKVVSGGWGLGAGDLGLEAVAAQRLVYWDLAKQRLASPKFLVNPADAASGVQGSGRSPGPS
jgi:hypothetical protein